MSFINAEVDVASLPAVENVPLIPINKDYIRLLRIEWLIAAVFLTAVGIALIIFIPEIRQSWWWVVIVVIILLLLLPYYYFQEKGFRHKAYAVRERDVIYQSGWLLQTTKVCPFSRVQNCSIGSGPLERKYGLASLTLYTAGTEGADMRIPGLLHEEAERLRQFILNKVDEAPAS